MLYTFYLVIKLFPCCLGPIHWKALTVIVRKDLLTNLKVRGSTIGPSNIKLRVRMYFPLCTDVAKMHDLLMLMTDIDDARDINHTIMKL